MCVDVPCPVVKEKMTQEDVMQGGVVQDEEVPK